MSTLQQKLTESVVTEHAWSFTIFLQWVWHDGFLRKLKIYRIRGYLQVRDFVVICSRNNTCCLIEISCVTFPRCNSNKHFAFDHQAYHWKRPSDGPRKKNKCGAKVLSATLNLKIDAQPGWDMIKIAIKTFTGLKC